MEELGPWLPARPGTFLEAGANDGLRQSSTASLAERGWRGVLVEGIPELAAACRRNRPESLVVQCALVPPEDHGRSVTMHFGDLASLVSGAQGSEEADRTHVDFFHPTRTYDVEVPGRTLSSVLDEARLGELDLLVLDVEGYEVPVLRGLGDHRPRLLVAEALDDRRLAALDEHLTGMGYERVAQLTRHDHLFRPAA